MFGLDDAARRRGRAHRRHPPHRRPRVRAPLARPTATCCRRIADGVNAAATHESTPPEYRALLFRLRALAAAGFAGGRLRDRARPDRFVVRRDRARRGRARGRAARRRGVLLADRSGVRRADGRRPPGARCRRCRALAGAHAPAAVAWNGENVHDALGSNEWAAGAQRTRDRARAAGQRPAPGARAFPGSGIWSTSTRPANTLPARPSPAFPGVILGHNERLAWGATERATPSVRACTPKRSRRRRRPLSGRARGARTRRCGTRRSPIASAHAHDARLSRDAARLRARRERARAARGAVGADLPIRVRRSAAFLALDRAGSIEAALRALARYPGPTQNFTLAQTDGRAALHARRRRSPTIRPGDCAPEDERAPATPLTLRAVRAAAARRTGARCAGRSAPTTFPTAPAIRTGSAPYFSAPYRAAEIGAALARRAEGRRRDVARDPNRYDVARRSRTRARCASRRCAASGAYRDPDARAGLCRAGRVRRPLRSGVARRDRRSSASASSPTRDLSPRT